MKKYRGRIAVVAIVVLLLGAYLIYTRPLPLSSLPLSHFVEEGYQPEAVTQIQGWRFSPSVWFDSLDYRIDDPAAVAELMALTESVRARRTLWSPNSRTLSPKDNSYHLYYSQGMEGPITLGYELYRSPDFSYIAIGWTRYRISRKDFDALAACLEANLPADYLERQRYNQELIDSWNQE